MSIICKVEKTIGQESEEVIPGRKRANKGCIIMLATLRSGWSLFCGGNWEIVQNTCLRMIPADRGRKL